MKIFEIIKFIERWAPRGSAWERDNPGLQVGSEENILKNVFICLELTEETLNEALEFNSNFIISHHPLIFNPLKRINTTKDPVSILINKLIKNDITLYSAHTNLDFTLGGVSFALAKLLKLKNIKFLRPLEQNQSKIVVFVPENELQKVSDAIFKAGGGVIGNYKKCSYRLKGEGTFEGGGDSNPTVGERGVFESVEEVRLEVVVNNWMIGKVVDAIRSSHSYEEPAFDIYPLKNGSVNYGAGAIGDFDIPYSSSSFLEELLCVLDIPVLKHSAVSETDIKKVAVCGGSGSDLLNEAIAMGADAFITADVRYHSFAEAKNNILLIDAGHFETEVIILKEIKRRVLNFLEKTYATGVDVRVAETKSNYVNYYTKT